MQTQKHLLWLCYALSQKLLLLFLIVLFVIPIESHTPYISPIHFIACTGPTITTPPTNQNTCPGSDISFSVVATGVGQLSYQWQENNGTGFTNITGAINASYTINAVSASQNNYTYQVIIMDDNGTTGDTADDCMTTSSIATLTVIDITCNSSPWSGNN